MLGDVETAVQEAFENHELICEVICPTQLYPLDVRPILQSVGTSGRLLVVEEGVSFAAFGAEVIAKITELAPGALRAVKRLASPEHPIPSCGPLEKQVLPNPNSILGAIVEVASR
jgi:2-oxoisovalerate dehydrogenase E1 component